MVITRVKVAGADVQCGLIVNRLEIEPVAPFVAGDDWLQNITMQFLNRTDKTIVCAQIRLEFPETGDGSRERPIKTESVDLGRIPAQSAYSSRTGKPFAQSGNRRFIAFAPGQVLTIRVGDYTEIGSDVKPLTKSTIRVTDIYFLDGMGWNLAGYYNPDPDHGKFKYMPRGYFPGNVQNNWPPPYRN